MNNFLDKTIICKNIKWSALIAFSIEIVVRVVIFILENLVGNEIVQWLNTEGFNLASFIKWVIVHPVALSIILFLLFLAWLMYKDWKLSTEKEKTSEKESFEILLIPNYDKINQEDLWEEKSAWLEIVGISKTNNLVALMKKLDSKTNKRESHHLEELTNSLSPRLKIVDEKLFVILNTGIDSTIALNNGKSKPFPKNINKFFVEINLMKDEEKIAEFKGYLIKDLDNWKLENS